MIHVKYGNQQQELKALVVKGSGPNLLGRDWLKVTRLDWNTIFQIASDNPQAALQGVLANIQLSSLKVWEPSKE